MKELSGESVATATVVKTIHSDPGPPHPAGASRQVEKKPGPGFRCDPEFPDCTKKENRTRTKRKPTIDLAQNFRATRRAQYPRQKLTAGAVIPAPAGESHAVIFPASDRARYHRAESEKI
ncbi:hypothetical protein [Microbulbifer sp. SAOS-129_SWC]|uniref:hypothetical protein n=1 Tax=Microbulbifer sp. SAOS-129_SWC TaxID=3145235 RepID=UPI003217CBBA